MNRFARLALLSALAAGLSSCSSVTEMVTANLPQRHSGRPSIVVKLREQQAYLYRGRHLAAASRISSGREGHRTPVGSFSVIRKDVDHRSSIYGAFVDESGRVVRPNVDARKDPKPPHSKFIGASMPFFVNSHRDTDCTRDICPACRRRMDVSGCRTGKPDSFTTPLTSAFLSW